MPLIIPNKFATRVGSIQLAEMDENFQYLASEFDRLSGGITISGTATALSGNLSVAGTSNFTGLATAANLAVTSGLTTNNLTISGSATAPTAAAGTSNTQLATTQFVATALGTSIPTGVIVMWSGSIVSIPAGWVLCNGANGTPDLRDRFVIGAGSNYGVATTGGTKDAIVVAHNHTATSTVSDPGHFHTTSFYNINDYNQGSLSPGLEQFPDDQQGTANINTNTKTTGITVSTTVNSTGDSGTNANLPPYYALAYIMKS